MSLLWNENRDLQKRNRYFLFSRSTALQCRE